VSAICPPASREIKPLTIMVVTCSPVTPACCQSVPLAAQYNRTRSLTVRPAAVAVGMVSFAIIPAHGRLRASAGSNQGSATSLTCCCALRTALGARPKQRRPAAAALVILCDIELLFAMILGVSLHSLFFVISGVGGALAV
jgi:hypothetical protein